MINGKTPASATKVITDKVQINYSNLFVPRAASADQDPKYGACFLIDKNDKATMDKIKAAEAAAQLQGARLWNGTPPTGIKSSVRDGDSEKPDNLAFSGRYFLNASSKTPPGIVDRNLQEVSDPAQIGNGSFVRASLSFFAYKHAENAGISCRLNHVQLLGRGELPSNRSIAANDFDVVGDDDDLLG